VVDNAVFSLPIALSIPQMFAMKVRGCPKSCQMLDVFPPKFYGAGPTKVVARLLCLPWGTSHGNVL